MRSRTARHRRAHRYAPQVSVWVSTHTGTRTCVCRNTHRHSHRMYTAHTDSLTCAHKVHSISQPRSGGEGSVSSKEASQRPGPGCLAGPCRSSVCPACQAQQGPFLLPLPSEDHFITDSGISKEEEEEQVNRGLTPTVGTTGHFHSSPHPLYAGRSQGGLAQARAAETSGRNGPRRIPKRPWRRWLLT